MALETILPAYFRKWFEVIRLADRASDGQAIAGIILPVFRAGETYAIPRDLTDEQALAYWFADGHEVFVYQEGERILGTYFLQANQQGGGAHVANCGYITDQQTSGKGIARDMCLHSLERAKERGFRAMQFNFVVVTNERAIRLWQSLGFANVGRLPEAFEHPDHGFVDALVMFRSLL